MFQSNTLYTRTYLCIFCLVKADIKGILSVMPENIQKKKDENRSIHV